MCFAEPESIVQNLVKRTLLEGGRHVSDQPKPELLIHNDTFADVLAVSSGSAAWLQGVPGARTSAQSPGRVGSTPFGRYCRDRDASARRMRQGVLAALALNCAPQREKVFFILWITCLPTSKGVFCIATYCVFETLDPKIY